MAPGLSIEEQKNLAERVAILLETRPDNKQGNSFWASFNFHAEPEKIKEITEKLKAEPLIKRHMVVKKEVFKPESLLYRRRKIVPRTPAATQTEKPKVELEEIEKKLNEILKDEPQ